MTSRRIEELTAELQKADIRAAASKAGWKNECEAHQKARDALATERAARGQAEEMRNHWCNEYANSQNQLATAAEQRDTALALAKEHHANWKHAQQLLLEMRDERDTALARVKESDTIVSNQLRKLAEQHDSLQAAETALASAREIAQHMRECAGHAIAAFGPQKGMTVPYHGDFAGANPTVAKQILRFAESLSAALTSHPAPVAAHCRECVELGACPAEAERLFEESGDDEPEEDTESLIEQLDEALCSLLHTGGELGEHSPRAHLDLFYARHADAPVAAPCAGCASARELLEELDEGCDDISEFKRRLRAWLTSHPAKEKTND